MFVLNGDDTREKENTGDQDERKGLLLRSAGLPCMSANTQLVICIYRGKYIFTKTQFCFSILLTKNTQKKHFLKGCLQSRRYHIGSFH